MPLEIDLGQARRFLDLLSDGATVTFQTFDDSKLPGQRSKEAWIAQGTLDEHAKSFVVANERRLGIYVMVNEGDGKGRSTANVTRVRAIFLDLDGSPITPVLTHRIEPHAVIESSPGHYQVYYLVSDCPLERFSSVQKAIAHKFNADQSVSDLCRVMRVPGFYHQKKKDSPFRCRTVSLVEAQPYNLQALIDGFGIAEEEKLVAEVDRQPLPAFAVLRSEKIPVSRRHHTLMRYAVRFFREGMTQDEVYFQLQGINHTACADGPKPEDEIESIVRYAEKYAGPQAGITILVPGDDCTEPEETDLAIPSEFITSAPGLLGEIADSVHIAMHRPQPHFSFAAAMTTVGLLKAHRVRSESNIRTNVYTMAIGETGSGKSEAGKLCRNLLDAAGLRPMVLGKIPSEPGLRVALVNRGGIGVHFWDEMGLALQKMLSKNAQQFYSNIKDLLIELATEADSVIPGSELASKEGREAQREINQPCLSIYGNAQPDIFFDALTGAHSADGFYPRLLVFGTNDAYPEIREVVNSGPPEHLVARCRDLWSMPTNASKKGDLDTEINPRVIPYTPAAKRLLASLCKDVDRKMTTTKNPVARGVWARVSGHVERSALIAEDKSEISYDVLQWAADFMLQLSPAMVSTFLAKVSNNDHERKVKKVRATIEAAGPGGIGRNLIHRHNQALQKRDLTEILEQLTETGFAVKTIGKSATKTAELYTSTRFTRQSEALGAESNPSSDSPKKEGGKTADS